MENAKFYCSSNLIVAQTFFVHIMIYKAEQSLQRAELYELEKRKEKYTEKVIRKGKNV